jgi:uncharacterized protein YggT (Ycf19 family)
MNEWLFRILYLLRFVSMMAVVYLALHLVVAARIRDPRSKVAAFFTVLTSPLVRPVRALLPAVRSEQQVRLISLFAFIVLWFVLVVLTALASAAGSRF